MCPPTRWTWYNFRYYMKNKIQPKILKGFRDFLPDETLKRNLIIEKLKNVFELYGFSPLETPALEYGETLLGKYGQEADNLLYLFKDNGDRLVGLRYDQTVPLARVISMYPNLPKPFKRYQIQSVWRAENTQKGRYREFLQCDIDTVGTKDILADFEIIDCVFQAFKNLGFKNTTILLNDRKNFLGIDNFYINTIDKLPKIGEENVIKELIKKNLSKEKAENLLKIIKNKPLSDDLKNLFSLLKEKGYQENIDFVYQPTLARGLNYYTGVIYEVVSKDYQGGSLGGGGRYDNLIGLFTGKDIPAVGFAFGFDRIIEALNSLNLIKNNKNPTKVLVTVFSPSFTKQSLKIINQLRKNNIKSEIYLDQNSKLDKQLKYADKKNIPYVIIIGEEEISKNILKLKNMKTGEQKELKIEDCIKFLISN